MPNRSTDALFQLVKSLEKSEKRNFKLYVTRNTDAADLKIIQLFDELDKMSSYDEKQLLQKAKSITKQQLSNIKASLYKEILSSLRLIKDDNNIDIQLHELMDHARILYNKGLHLQSLHILDRMKKLAAAHNQVTYGMQILFFEKKIESLYITRSLEDRADVLIDEAKTAIGKLNNVSTLSNLALKLYGWYIRNGHARSGQDDAEVKKIFKDGLPQDVTICNSFYEKLYLFQSYCWYAFIRQDFLLYYRYTQKWVDLFEQKPLMIKVETAHWDLGAASCR